MSVYIGNEESYVGRVLEKYERNGRDDSDFIAVVWDDETNGTKLVEYDSTRHGGAGNAVVDATADVVKKARLEMYRFHLYRIQEKYAKMALEPTKGKLIRVEDGRKYKGRTGKIFWIGVNEFKSTYGYTCYNVGVEQDDGSRFFVPIDYVKVLDAGDYLEITLLEMKRRAARNSHYGFRMV